MNPDFLSMEIFMESFTYRNSLSHVSLDESIVPSFYDEMSVQSDFVRAYTVVRRRRSCMT